MKTMICVFALCQTFSGSRDDRLEALQVAIRAAPPKVTSYTGERRLGTWFDQLQVLAHAVGTDALTDPWAVQRLLQ